VPSPRMTKAQVETKRLVLQGRCLSMRIAGGDYDNIVATLAEQGHKITREEAEAFVDAELLRVRRDGENVDLLNLARLDTMLVSLWPKVREGDVKAASEAREIMDRKEALEAKLEPEKKDGLNAVQEKRARRLKAV
jgi:hypothetical protein